MNDQSKTMVVVFLVLLLAAVSGFSIFLYKQIGDLKADLSFKENQLTACDAELRNSQNQLTIIKQTVSNYEAEVKRLNSDIVQLQDEVVRSHNQVDSLNYELRSMTVERDNIRARVSQLQGSVDVYESQINEMTNLLNQYEKVPHGYYSTGSFKSHSNTYSELSSFLSWEFTLPRGYEAGVFDCSESAAYLEWALETAGFDAVIVVGPTPWSPDTGYHAWVIAYTVDYKVAIEATVLTGEYKFLDLFTRRIPGVVYGEDSRVKGWENYYDGYEALYENIYFAIRDYNDVDEWDWWYGFWGFS